MLIVIGENGGFSLRKNASCVHPLINEMKVDNSTLEEDTKDDPRFTMSAEELKKKGIEDFQLYYAMQTIGRSGGTKPTLVARATPPARKPASR